MNLGALRTIGVVGGAVVGLIAVLTLWTLGLFLPPLLGGILLAGKFGWGWQTFAVPLGYACLYLIGSMFAWSWLETRR